MGDRCNCESNRDKVRSLSAEIILEFTSRTAVCSSSAKLSGKGTRKARSRFPPPPPCFLPLRGGKLKISKRFDGMKIV